MPLPTGIIDTILHPPLGTLHPHRDGGGPYVGPGLFNGNYQFTDWYDSDHAQTLGVADSYGVIAQIAGSFPVPFGYRLGWVDTVGSILASGEEYEHRLYQINVLHQFLGGAWAITQRVDSHFWQTLVLWDEALPGMIGLNVTPGLSVDLFYLTLLV